MHEFTGSSIRAEYFQPELNYKSLAIFGLGSVGIGALKLNKSEGELCCGVPAVEILNDAILQ